MSKSRDIADSAATINYIDNLTSDAQSQINDKATLDGSPTFTGTVTATAFSGDGSGLTGVDSLPSQTGQSGKFLTTDGSAASWDAVDVSSEITGTLPVANGGTGATTLTANSVLLGNGTSAPLTVAPSTSGNVLTSNGTTWQSVAPSGGFEYVEYDVGGTSGFTLTGIPSGTKQIQIAFREVNIPSNYIKFQIGDSGGIETSGYAWANKRFYTTITQYRSSASDSSWEIFNVPSANGWSGNMTLSLVDSSTNTWVFSSQAASNYENCISNGRKDLSSELTQIKLLGGTFASGSKVSVIYQ